MRRTLKQKNKNKNKKIVQKFGGKNPLPSSSTRMHVFIAIKRQNVCHMSSSD
ncbi:hypothetical protein ACMBCN_01275 [Candidatus Liberibacter asiaticus]|nr:hypothetical protein [Candidatus Liberibacter asiaticus]